MDEQSIIDSIRRATLEIFELRKRNCSALAGLVRDREYRRVGDIRTHSIRAALAALENAMHVPMGES